MFSETGLEHDIYNNDIAAFQENMECIRNVTAIMWSLHPAT